jgi:hypothetical protein
MDDYDMERRIEQILYGQLQPAIEACGLEGYGIFDVLPAFERGDIDLSSCFRMDTQYCRGRAAAECVRGSLGTAALAMEQARLAIMAEKAQSKKRRDNWRAQYDFCEESAKGIGEALVALHEYEQAAEEARERGGGFFDTVFDGLGELTGANDLFDVLGDTVGGCIGSMLSPESLVSATATGGATLAEYCAGGSFGGFLKSDAGTSEALQSARDKLDIVTQRIALERELAACQLQLGQAGREYFAGIDFVQQRLMDMEQARHQFAEAARAAARGLAAAKAASERELGRTIPSIAFHYWLDEKKSDYEYTFARAKRNAYLAMLAAEYELQQSLGLRTEILTATHPIQLQHVLDRLDDERGTRSINSRRPEAGIEVLSLRRDVLGLADLGAGQSERPVMSTARMQDLLTGDAQGIYDENGFYVGQGIRFTLAESGALEHRCAERLWRVTATIQGDFVDADEPATHVFLLKNNVFKSQWCEGREQDGTGYQIASTAGGSNLFTGAGTADNADGSEFTTAMLYPWFNVRRSDFYRAAFGEGASEELAGRGLYGEYLLIFPYYGMLEPDDDCSADDERCWDPMRNLRRVEDVLLRFDYYSVDDLPQP